jgi:Sugar transferases involved in lipopolysaccharide synthesis
MQDQSYQADFIGFSGHGREALPSGSVYERFGKRPVDISCAAFLLMLSAPLMVAITLGLMLTGGTPVFAHRRVGRDGISFRCYKFRTMRKDSSRVLRFVLRTDPAAAEEWAGAQKLLDDPRVTRIGLLLRKTSLDELPQLFNVLRGDMSMVGPRPVTDRELPRYGRFLQAYLAVRPGVTGLWQVHGRGTTLFSERVEMDVAYIRKIRLLTDLKLMFQTAEVVLRRSGS